MELTSQDIMNLALIELGHETIKNWDDPTNTDIPIVNTQYQLAVPVALSKYQWSFADEYAILTTTPIESTDGFQKYKNSVALPTDALANVSCYTNKNLTVLANYDVIGNIIYTNLDTIYKLRSPRSFSNLSSVFNIDSV